MGVIGAANIDAYGAKPFELDTASSAPNITHINGIAYASQDTPKGALIMVGDIGIQLVRNRLFTGKNIKKI